MRQLLPLILIILGLLAVGTMVWVLFDSDEYASDLPLVEEPVQKADAPRQVITTHPPETGQPQDREAIPVEQGAQRQVEQLKPEHDASFFNSTITINVAFLKTGQPVDKGTAVDFQVLFNGVPLNKSPKAMEKSGSYVLRNLLPGSYEINAHTADWMKGSASCDLAPDARADLSLWIDSGDHLKLQIVNELTDEPVHNARLQARGFIQGGTTDENGSFTSARKFIPDGSMTIEISHPSYFNQAFSPLEPERSGAERIGTGYDYCIRLTPLSGDLSLSGTVIDENGEPIQRLALFLSPEQGHPAKGTSTTYTNRSGYFNFTRLQPGRYRLRVTMRFLASHLIKDPPCFFDQIYTLHPGQSLLDLKLACTLPRTAFSGFVYLAQSYEPADSATVSYESSLTGVRNSMNNKDSLAFESVTTDALGWFTTSESYHAEDIYRMIVYGNIKVTTKDGIVSFCRPRKTPEGLRQMQADILANRPVTLWVVSSGEKALTGNVSDAAGSPLSGVRITADSEMDIAQGRLRAYSDESGYFQIANLFPGKWTLSAMIPKGPALRQSITIPVDKDPPPVTIRVQDSCSVEGEIVINQEPGRMSIRVEGLDFETESQKIGSKLWYSFQNLPPGRVKLILEVYNGRRYQERYLSVEEAWVELKKGKVARRDFSL